MTVNHHQDLAGNTKNILNKTISCNKPPLENLNNDIGPFIFNHTDYKGQKTMCLLKEDDNLNFLTSYLIKVAKMATCKRSKCGSIIVANGIILGEGFNSMPCDGTGECFKDNLAPTFKSDRSCCVHAEQRAIMNALKNKWRDQIKGSTLFFIRLDENDNPKHSGAPYCSICSKMALDVGISNFVLWHKEGWTSYNTKEYNEQTFQYK